MGDHARSEANAITLEGFDPGFRHVAGVGRFTGVEQVTRSAQRRRRVFLAGVGVPFSDRSRSDEAPSSIRSVS